MIGESYTRHAPSVTKSVRPSQFSSPQIFGQLTHGADAKYQASVVNVFCHPFPRSTSSVFVPLFSMPATEKSSDETRSSGWQVTGERTSFPAFSPFT